MKKKAFSILPTEVFPMRSISVVFLAVFLLFGCIAESEKTSDMEEKMEELEEKVENLKDYMEDVEDRVDALEEEVEALNNVTNKTTDQNITTSPPKGKTRFLVTVKNVHDTQTLSPGVFIVHKPPYSINFIGKLAPPELEPLAEYGNHTPFAKYVNKSSNVLGVYTIDKPIAPGESKSFTMDVSTYMPRESYLSGIMMAVGSNDGFALANNIALFDPGNGPKASTTNALNYDAGTEQNSLLLSGFSGGQPDPSKGAENIDNGVATSPQQPVIPHTQISKTIMKVTITPQP
jgi:outer membrane murein-binding lipoprotein Lpp